jgi:metallophosphoesterase (TIGR03768 family)
MRIKTENRYSILITVVFLVLINSSCRKDNISNDPALSHVFTTLEKTVISIPLPATPVSVFPYEISKYTQYGYGGWQFGPGLAFEKRLDLMPLSYSAGAVNKSADLLHFFTISDIHITDKESPAQQIVFGYKGRNYYKGGNSSAYSAVILYTTQMFNAVVKTINAIEKEKKFDFGISLGDVINNAQYNELRWYIDVLDGGIITPSSGNHDGAESIDYQKSFKAEGLDNRIPWYQVIGNHDHFSTGMFIPDESIRKIYVGDNILNMGNLMTDPNAPYSRGYYMGSVDGATPFGNIIGAGPVDSFPIPPKINAADPNRRFLMKGEWIGEFFNSTSSPIGHGFNQSDAARGFSCYSFEPKSSLPVKVIVLDDTENENDLYNYGMGHGSLDQQRYDWLLSELDKGQSEGKLMIIAAHIPIGVDYGEASPAMKWNSSAAVTEANLIAKLHTYPNLILWIAGHLHLNIVTALKSPDDTKPELGFWEVETASLRDFPQQFRTFDIVRNSDNTISIFTTDVDPEVSEDLPAAKSRSYSIATQQIFDNILLHAPSGTYNAELVKQLSPEMQSKIMKSGTLIKK